MFRNENFLSKKEETQLENQTLIASEAHFMIWKAFRVMKLFAEYFTVLVDWQLARLNW